MKNVLLPPAEPIAQALDVWFRAGAKDYPWRRTTDPYAILVSEMMLQQTQIPTVLDRGFYERWMERFPNLATLAIAAESDVLRAWEGLGYYRRARFLHQMAQAVVREHGGIFPTDLALIRALPGIGAYTAGAVMSFAYDKSAPIVDGNVARVISRLCNDATPIDSTEGLKRLWERAEGLLAFAKSPRIHNGALMELGQLICRPTQPNCRACPVQTWCQAEDPASLPVKSKKTVITEVTERVIFHQSEAGVLLEQETGKRRTGLWKLPELPAAATFPPVLHRASYTITRYKVTLWVHEAPMPDVFTQTSTFRYVSSAELPDLPMPSPYRKALNAVLAQQDFRLG